MGIRHASDLRLCASPQVNAGLTAGAEQVCSNPLAAAESENKRRSQGLGVFGTHDGRGVQPFMRNQIHEIPGQVTHRRASEAVGGRVACSVDNSVESASSRLAVGPNGNGPCRIRCHTPMHRRRGGVGS